MPDLYTHTRAGGHIRADHNKTAKQDGGLIEDDDGTRGLGQKDERSRPQHRPGTHTHMGTDSLKKRGIDTNR